MTNYRKALSALIIGLWASVAVAEPHWPTSKHIVFGQIVYQVLVLPDEVATDYLSDGIDSESLTDEKLVKLMTYMRDVGASMKSQLTDPSVFVKACKLGATEQEVAEGFTTYDDLFEKLATKNLKSSRKGLSPELHGYLMEVVENLKRGVRYNRLSEQSVDPELLKHICQQGA